MPCPIWQVNKEKKLILLQQSFTYFEVMMFPFHHFISRMKSPKITFSFFALSTKLYSFTEAFFQLPLEVLTFVAANSHKHYRDFRQNKPHLKTTVSWMQTFEKLQFETLVLFLYHLYIYINNLYFKSLLKCWFLLAGTLSQTTVAQISKKRAFALWGTLVSFSSNNVIPSHHWNFRKMSEILIF